MGSRCVEHVEEGRLPANTNEMLTHCLSITTITKGGQNMTDSIVAVYK